MWYKIFNLKLTKLIVLVLGIYISIQMGRNLLTLWGAKSRVTEAEDNLKKLQLKNQMIKDQEKEVGTPEFAERQAREKLGLIKEGEVIFVLPPEEIKKLADSMREEYFQKEQNHEELTNWQKWRKFFMD